MEATLIGAGTFLGVFGSAIAGIYMRRILPPEQLNKDAIDVIKMATGLIATMAALVLGMLISSAKGSFDHVNGEMMQSVSKVILLDRMLANYGPETRPMREALKAGYAAKLDVIASGNAARIATLDTPEAVNRTEMLLAAIGQLAPQTDMQRGMRARALQVAGELASTREIVLLQKDGSIAKPLLAVLIAWLVIIFAAFGLFAPGNQTVVVALLLCALSAAGAIFLILEMDRPLDGVIRISSAPLFDGLARLGR